MQFKLVSPFKPSPGQEKAVEQLIKNFSTKDKQTLLGITGSGKSVTSDTDVIIRKNKIESKEKIGQLIDKLFIQNESKIKNVNEIEILDASSLVDVYEAYSFNPATKKTEWKKIQQFIRHPSPKNLYKIISKCGREITVTEDHNFFALRNEEVVLLKSTELNNKDFLPIPTKIESPTKPLKNADINTGIYREIKIVKSPSNFTAKTEDNELGKINCSSYIANPHYNGYSSNQTCTELVYDNLESEVNQNGGQLELNKEQQNSIKITDDLLTSLGYYITENYQEKKDFAFVAADEIEYYQNCKVISTQEICFSKRAQIFDSVDSFPKYLSALKSWCGKEANSKHLPHFWVQLSNKQLAKLLRSYFSADGYVDENTVKCITKSKQLASDILYSLLRFGIVAFVKKKANFTSNTDYRKAYWEITISGKFIKTFQKEIGFTQKLKNNDLKKTIAKLGNIDKDIIPTNALIKKIRKTLDVSQKNLSTLAQITQPYLSLIENGKIMPSRETTTRIMAAFNFLAKQNHIDVQSEISKLSSLLNLFWSPISKIEPVNGEEYVYDFSVESNETFLAGTGGIFVHNTFVMANLINRLQKPTLILAHNKTLAAQLYAELKELFPQNRVEYFISFYDYYQPESYLPTTDMYIEKDSSVNEQIEKMRMHAVSSVVSRNDTIIVASISCIYSLGNPEDYKTMAIDLTIDEPLPRQKLINALVDMQYERNDMVLEAGKFRVRGETIDIVPAYEKDILRVELEAGKIKKIKEVDAVTGDSKTTIDKVTLYPARQYVVPEEKMKRAFVSIEAELESRLQELPPLEAQRLKQRTNYDLEMMKEMGFCAGIENYSRHFDGRKAGEPPFTLMDYFPKDYLLIIDESHQTIPQSRAMYNGEFSRKKNLIEFGFRLPSAYDNRPLKFEEFEKKMGRTLFVSATPADYETEKSGAPVELITRPTGLLDPIVELHPIKGQMQHLMEEAKKTIENGDRILITTLTKRMAEDLTEYLVKEGFRVRYMHSEIDSLDRIELVRQLRAGDYDILVGINLLREGLDIPEVSTIFILDADKEGFLRDERSLIQTIGRAARNVNGRVILYADIITRSIKRAMEITQYRRNFQIRFNKVHNITPKTIVKSVSQKESTIKGIKHLAKADVQRQIIELDAQMREAAEKLDFEKAIQLRDTIQELNKSLAQKAKTQQSQ